MHNPTFANNNNNNIPHTPSAQSSQKYNYQYTSQQHHLDRIEKDLLRSLTTRENNLKHELILRRISIA